MNIVWFRRDLRVDDNSALLTAIETGKPVVAVYVATPGTWQDHRLAPMQADLIYRRLFELQRDLIQLNIVLLYAEVDTFFQSVVKVVQWADELEVDSVYLNKEYELDESRRDDILELSLNEKGKRLYRFDDKCIFAPGTVVNRQGGYFKVFTPFKKAYLNKLNFDWNPPKKVTRAFIEATPGHSDSDVFNQFSSFGYPRIPSDHYPAETAAIYGRIRRFNLDTVERYHEQRDYPSIQATSGLSPYLAIGALSVRQCMARVMFQQSLSLSPGREIWQSELIWREFYQHLIFFEHRLSRGESFSIWGEHLRWLNRQSHIEAWKAGETGFPIVDAAIRQLNQTGWMHNRLRMITASFLIKDLHVDWRIGEAYFMSKLIDGDYAANNGGWQWCASTGCDGQPYFRIFNPTTQGERFDPQGKFVCQWIPELADVPDKFVHRPWKWNNVKALSYPRPIVDHKIQREITLANYKKARAA